MSLGRQPQPTAPWRHYIFRVHCIVTQRWMKIRVPFAWFWYGESEYGQPEVESGTIASSNPQPPAAALARRAVRVPMANDGGALPEEELVPYETPQHRQETLEEKVDRLERLASSAFDATHPQGSGR